MNSFFNTRWHSAIFTFFVVAVIASCKKSSNNSPGSLLLATVDVAQQGAIEHYRFVYNSGNDVDSIIIVGGGVDTGSFRYQSFTYFNTSYNITDASNNTFSVIDSDGLIEEVVQTDTILLTYYNNLLGLQTIKSPSIAPPFYTERISSYSWQNGNLNTITDGSTVYSFTYNSAKGGQIGDGCRIDDFLTYGKPFFKTNNLPTQLLANGSWVESYFYTFDQGGRISQFIRVQNNLGASINDTTVYTYSYYF